MSIQQQKCLYTTQGKFVCNTKANAIVFGEQVESIETFDQHFSQPGWVPKSVPMPTLWTEKPATEWQIHGKESHMRVAATEQKTV